MSARFGASVRGTIVGRGMVPTRSVVFRKHSAALTPSFLPNRSADSNDLQLEIDTLQPLRLLALIKDEERIQWYTHQLHRVRSFVETHLSHLLVKVDIEFEDSVAGKVLNKALVRHSEFKSHVGGTMSSLC